MRSLVFFPLAESDVVLDYIYNFTRLTDDGQLPMVVLAYRHHYKLNLPVEQIYFLGPPFHLLKLYIELRHHRLLKYHLGLVVERVLPYRRLC